MASLFCFLPANILYKVVNFTGIQWGYTFFVFSQYHFFFLISNVILLPICHKPNCVAFFYHFCTITIEKAETGFYSSNSLHILFFFGGRGYVPLTMFHFENTETTKRLMQNFWQHRLFWVLIRTSTFGALTLSSITLSLSLCTHIRIMCMCSTHNMFGKLWLFLRK